MKDESDDSRSRLTAGCAETNTLYSIAPSGARGTGSVAKIGS